MDSTQHEEQKKKLERLNAFGKAYGEKLTNQEVDNFLFTQNSIPVEGSPEQKTRERIIAMMMVDTENARDFGVEFGDLYTEARSKKRALKEQADISGMEKVKNDFFGTKKRAAREALSDIREKKAKLSAAKPFLAIREQAWDEIEERREELDRQLENAQTEEERAHIRMMKDSMLSAVEDLKDESPVIAIDRVVKGSSYEWLCADAQTRFFSESPVTTWNKVTQTTVQVQYSQDMFYRDMVRFVGEEDALSQNGPEIMRKTGDDFWIVTHGHHATCEFVEDTSQRKNLTDPPVMVPKELPEEEQKAAFLRLQTILETKYTNMKSFETQYSDLLRGKLSAEEVLGQYREVREASKMMQVVAHASLQMLKSKTFKSLTEKEKADFIELHDYLSAMKITLFNLFLWLTDQSNVALSGEPTAPLQEESAFDKLYEKQKNETQQYLSGSAGMQQGTV